MSTRFYVLFIIIFTFTVVSSNQSTGLAFGSVFDETNSEAISFYRDLANNLVSGVLAFAVLYMVRKLWNLLKASNPFRTAPPSFGKKLLIFFMPNGKSESLIGDLEEEFATYILPELGPFWANMWYWKQVIRSVLVNNKWIGWLFGGLGGLGGIAAAIGSFFKRRDD